MKKIPLRYLPFRLTRRDRVKQLNALTKSRKMYKRGKYYTRPRVDSFKSRKSPHILRAEQMYGVDRILPNKELAEKTKCSIAGLTQIVKKGEGAYYSSGSRPNQTARSWGLARLASAITGGKASAVDFHILEKTCDHKKSKAFRLAKPPQVGRKQTRKIYI